MHSKISKQLLRDPWFLSGLCLGIFFIITASLGPYLAPFDPWDMSFVPITTPSRIHLLGINDGGQDIFSELIYAIRNTIVFGFVSGLTALALGVFIGVVAGWFGGLVDLVLMRVADVMMAIPAIMILILTAAVFKPPPGTLAIVMAGFIWPTISKAIRVQTLTLKQSLHVKASRQMGGSNWYIIRRHLIPELFPLYLIGLAAKIRMAMFMEASLAFLGLFEPTRKSLGMMIGYALKYYYLNIWWNWLLPPILCLSLLIMTVTFLAISLEKRLDPRLRENLLEKSA